MKKLIFLVILSLSFISTTGCAIEMGPWHGKVIDAKTKQPIEGAAVVAVFGKDCPALGSGPVEYFYDAKETLTDKNGDFYIPVFRSITFICGIRFPEFTIFKPGYGSFPQYQVSPKSSFISEEGTVVELPRVTDKNKRLGILSTTESQVVTWMDAPSKKVPSFIKLIHEEDANLGLRGRAK